MIRGAAFQLGDWVVDPTVRTLTRGTETRRVEPKLMAVLLALVDNAGRPVTREELEQAAWATAIIGPDTLSRAISKLRSLLDDDRSQPQLIQTIPKVGYVVTEQPQPVPQWSPLRLRGRTIAWGGGVSLALGVCLATVVLLFTKGPRDTDIVELAVVPLTSEPGYESSPSISPDGQLVAYERYDKAADEPNWDVYIKAIGTGQAARPLASSSDTEYGPAWSPTGDSIAYVVRSDHSCAIVIASANTAGTRPLSACNVDDWYTLSWFPDGETLIMSQSGSKGPLFAISRTSGAVEVMSLATDDRVIQLPRVSNDGRALAFVGQRAPGISDIFIADLNGTGRVRRVTFDNRRIDGLAWLLDSDLAFTSNRGGTSHLWRMPTTHGSEPTRVAMTGRNASHISVASNGTLAYEEYAGDSNIWEIPGGTDAAAHAWTTSTRSDWSPRYSPNGEHVVFLSDRTGSAEIWVADADGSNEQQISDLRGGVVDPPRWAQNGRAIVYSAALDGHYDVFFVELASGATRRITNHDANDRAPSWIEDERAIVFVSDRSGSWQLWQAGDPPTQLTVDEGFGPLQGAHGTILYTKPGRAGLWQMRLTDRSETLLWDMIQPDDWNNWTLATDGILYFHVAQDDEPVLWYRSLGDGSVTKMPLQVEEAPPNAGISVNSVDGSILYSRIDHSESDLWVIDASRPIPK